VEQQIAVTQSGSVADAMERPHGAQVFGEIGFQLKHRDPSLLFYQHITNPGPWQRMKGFSKNFRQKQKGTRTGAFWGHYVFFDARLGFIFL
jgi:hypothetical protein